MTRLLTPLLVTALLVAMAIPWAGAHMNALYAHVSVDSRGEVTLRVVDFYGALVEGQQPVAYATAPGGRPTESVTLAESQPGTYRGVVTVPGAERYTVTVEITLLGELHRLRYDVTAGQGQPEQMMPMEQVEPPKGTNWSRILYLAAAAVLVIATAVALLKKKSVAEGESE